MRGQQWSGCCRPSWLSPPFAAPGQQVRRPQPLQQHPRDAAGKAPPAWCGAGPGVGGGVGKDGSPRGSPDVCRGQMSDSRWERPSCERDVSAMLRAVLPPSGRFVLPGGAGDVPPCQGTEPGGKSTQPAGRGAAVPAALCHQAPPCPQGMGTGWRCSRHRDAPRGGVPTVCSWSWGATSCLG